MHRDTLQFVHDKLVNAPVGVEAREKNRIAMARIARIAQHFSLFFTGFLKWTFYGQHIYFNQRLITYLLLGAHKYVYSSSHKS